MEKFKWGRDFDWDDLGQLVCRTAAVDREKITTDCMGGYRFLLVLTEEEMLLSNTSSIADLIHYVQERSSYGAT